MIGEDSWFKILALPAFLPTVLAIFATWRWYVNRNDRLNEKQLTAAEQREINLLKDREFLSKDLRDAITRLQNELKETALAGEAERLRADAERMQRVLAERQSDRNRWIANFWYPLARELHHELNNTRTMVIGLLNKHEKTVEPPGWRDFDVPKQLEEPYDRLFK